MFSKSFNNPIILLRAFPYKNNNLGNIIFKKFSEVIPKEQEQQLDINKVPKSLDDLIYKNSSLSPEEIDKSKRQGIDLFLNQQKLSIIENSGFYFNNNKSKLNLGVNAESGWRLRYLKNMGLLYEYDDIFREFLQNCAKVDSLGIDLYTEPRLSNLIQFKLKEMKGFGFNLEIDDIKIRQNHQILRIEIYKNLSIDRRVNGEFSKQIFNKVPTGLAPLVIAKEMGKDNSLALNKKPFILATTMLIRSPMRLNIWNQNHSKEFKLNEQDLQEYVVRFETQMTYSDFGWILPTQNKPSRLKNTKITDFNNVLRGNPYFKEKFDLIDENLRYTYMVKDNKLDEEIKEFFDMYGKTDTANI